MLRDRLLQIGGDEGLDDDPARRILGVQHALLEERLRAVVRDERTDLVAREQFHLSTGVADRHAHAIAIGIGRDHQVGVFLRGQLDCRVSSPRRSRDSAK